MRAMFVNNVDWAGDAYDDIHMEIGDVFHIVGEAIGYGRSNIPCICWEFAEFGPEHLFDKRNFATLPEQSAYEMAIEQHEALIYQR